MEVVWIQVNALSGIAEMRAYGSHYDAACVLCRVAFEASVTAYWLAQPEDWKDRESRWLRWVRKEEDYRKRLGKEIESSSPSFSQRLDSERISLESRRLQIAALLHSEYLSAGFSEAEAQKRCVGGGSPNFRTILNETDLGPQRYIAYTVLSHSTHVGPSVAEAALRVEGNAVTPILTHGPNEWPLVFETASWCVTAPVQRILARCTADTAKVHDVIDAHQALLHATDKLRRIYELR